ncbi:MAG: circularly permuted type 2 ATP-grasp protein [Pseudomonadales bacterium]|nr:circularly permuted type 2 ATP-grasp protein [Pseudomonadales bacterium]
MGDKENVTTTDVIDPGSAASDSAAVQPAKTDPLSDVALEGDSDKSKTVSGSARSKSDIADGLASEGSESGNQDSEEVGSEQGELGFMGSPYIPLDGSFDEMVDKSGAVRPHWSNFSRYFRRATGAELTRLRRETQRRLKEQGVNYNVYHDPEGMRRTWQLDPLPLVIDGDDWRSLEQGLEQRARLFSMLLTDILGHQTCIREGLVPPELVLQNPGLLNSVIGSPQQPLSLFAVDITRGPKGEWWVLSDRTQSPSGAGYVLEARMVSRRVLGANGGEQIAPLGQFFYHFKRQMMSLAPDQTKEPTIVLLSPGIGNEVYFEHAYLVAQLGITLVQGDDLTVRQGRVYLKTVDDLKQVDVIIRRVDDSFCDPLNFRADSMLGVPGLAQAQLLGRVGMANPLGAGILESPGLLPFLPRLAKHFLAEELKLPNVATWWCGQEKERQHVLANLDRMVIKKVDRSCHAEFGGQLSAKDKQQLKEKINATPWLYAGQELINFSTVPTLTDDAIVPRHHVLRGFAVGNGESYNVMPGGLCRVSPVTNTFVVSGQGGGQSKDTWVLSKQSTRENVAPIVTRQRRTSAAVLTSRAAEHLFWMARYLERSESLLRLIRAYMKRLESYHDYGFESDLHVLSSFKTTFDLYCQTGNRLLRTDSMQSLVLNAQKVGSVAFNLHMAIQSAYTVRDLWSWDCWRAIEELEELLEYSERNWSVLASDQFIQPFLTALLAFWGASRESLALDQGGLWLQIGRRHERALNTLFGTAAICREFDLEGEDSHSGFGIREVLLEAHDCLNSHRRRYGTELSFYTVWQHLLLEPSNPRSVVSALAELEPYLKHLNVTPHRGLIALEKRILAVTTPLQLADAGEWYNAELTVTKLAPFLQELKQKLDQFGFDIEHQYFKHAQPVTRLLR